MEIILCGNARTSFSWSQHTIKNSFHSFTYTLLNGRNDFSERKYFQTLELKTLPRIEASYSLGFHLRTMYNDGC